MHKLYLLILLLMFSSNSMAIDIASECATLTNDRARLNCYDALFQEPMKTGTPAPKQLESMATPTTLRPPVSQQSTNTNTAIALMKVHRNPPNKTLYVLSNGETRLQTNHQPNTFSPGDVVDLKPEFMGSTFMVSSTGLSIRVKKLT